MARPAGGAPSAMRVGAGSPVRGAMVRTATSSPARTVVARPGSARVRVSGGVIHVVRRNPPAVRRAVVNNQDFFSDDGIPVPGLGFDFVHFAATHPNFFNRRRTNLGGFFPFFSGGFLMPSVPVVVDEESGDEPEEAHAAEEASRRHVHVLMPESAPSAAAEPAPAMPSEEYVFVRRDGTVFFAVAYSWENGALRYITSQGLRGTVTREALDLPATQQFNDQRGLSFHAPA